MPNKILNFKSNVKNPFQITNASSTKAEIVIYGAIGDDMWDASAISADKFSKELAKLPKTVNEISVRINSPGGSVFDGLAIYERLKQHPANVKVYVDGIAASIASIIAMAGDEIIMGESTFLMIHKPLTLTWGNADEHERNINILDGIERQMLGIYSKKSGMSKDQIANMLTQETWMTSEEAINMGFATSVASDGENLRVAASMIKAPWLAKTNPPQIDGNKELRAKIAISKAKVEEFLSKKK